jgi:hypothetical protein
MLNACNAALFDMPSWLRAQAEEDPEAAEELRELAAYAERCGFVGKLFPFEAFDMYLEVAPAGGGPTEGFGVGVQWHNPKPMQHWKEEWVERTHLQAQAGVMAHNQLTALLPHRRGAPGAARCARARRLPGRRH